MHLPAIDSYTLLCLEWLIGSVLVGALGLLVLIYSDSIPNFIHRCVKYGKSAELHVNDKLRLLELPKRYFFHFYSIALVFYLTLLSKALISPESVIIGLLLLTIQVTRRLYECRVVSVYSDSRMNIVHYMFGHLFYIGVGLSMLAEAPGFTEESSIQEFRPNKFEFLTTNHIVGVLLFLYSSYIQFDSTRMLANLRKDTTGRVITTKHSIPRGKWFELVSSPHYMAEIMIYLAITIVLGGKSFTWWMVFLFVVTNQVFVGKFNHSWYLEKFRDYPRSRRAVIPYIL